MDGLASEAMVTRVKVADGDVLASVEGRGWAAVPVKAVEEVEAVDEEDILWEAREEQDARQRQKGRRG